MLHRNSDNYSLTGGIYLAFLGLNVTCFIYGISPNRAVNIFHHGYKNNRLVMYKPKVTVCVEIRTKYLMQSEYHVEFLNFQPGGKR